MSGDPKCVVLDELIRHAVLTGGEVSDDSRLDWPRCETGRHESRESGPSIGTTHVCSRRAMER